MTRQTIPIPVKGSLMMVALLAASAALADPPQGSPLEPKNDKRENGPGPDAEEMHRRDAEKVVNGIEVEVLSDDQWMKVKRIEKPLLFYGDSTRENDRGSVWAWGEQGRPLVLLELFQNVNDRARWVYTICNTSGKKVRARRGGTLWWQENDSASELKEIPSAPPPAAEVLPRQRQLKQLAQKFTGHEFWDPNNSRYELRRLERALYTYRDEAGGVLEGGLFTLANGTNPEIMLFIEARVDPKGNAKAAWQYTVGRLSHAELHLEYDGKEVFNSPRGDRLSGANKPYWLGLFDTTRDAKPQKQ
jgi:hypothetical protein